MGDLGLKNTWGHYIEPLPHPHQTVHVGEIAQEGVKWEEEGLRSSWGCGKSCAIWMSGTLDSEDLPLCEKFRVEIQWGFLFCFGLFF